MGDFFVRKTMKGIVIPEAGSYDITNEDDCKACGLDYKSFQERNVKMFDGNNGFEVKEGNNPVASIATRLEDHFSKRELAFLLSKEMLNRLMAEIEAKKNGK